jgi:hypothetical protein
MKFASLDCEQSGSSHSLSACCHISIQNADRGDPALRASSVLKIKMSFHLCCDLESVMLSFATIIFKIHCCFEQQTYEWRKALFDFEVGSM